MQTPRSRPIVVLLLLGLFLGLALPPPVSTFDERQDSVANAQVLAYGVDDSRSASGDGNRCAAGHCLVLLQPSGPGTFGPVPLATFTSIDVAPQPPALPNRLDRPPKFS